MSELEPTRTYLNRKRELRVEVDESESSRTGLDPATLARSLRIMAGDGSIEWVMEPIQASVLLDIADALDENAKLRELLRDMFGGYKGAVEMLPSSYSKSVMEMAVVDISDRMRELGVEVD